MEPSQDDRVPTIERRSALIRTVAHVGSSHSQLGKALIRQIIRRAHAVEQSQRDAEMGIDVRAQDPADYSDHIAFKCVFAARTPRCWPSREPLKNMPLIVP